MPKKLAGLALVLLLCATAVPALVRPATAQDARPNIILINLDDSNAGLWARMPAVQKLMASGGTHFPNFVVTDPQCCPSRASLLRGQYPHNTGILTNDDRRRGGYAEWLRQGHDANHLGVWLRREGYETMLVGKTFNGSDVEDRDPGWTRWVHNAGGGYTDYDLNVNGTIKRYEGDNPDNYLTDVEAAYAVDFVRDRENGGPWFLYLAPKAPHEPYQPAERYRGAFGKARPPRPPSYDEDDVSDKPPWVRNRPRVDDKKVTARYRQRLRLLAAVDDQIRRVLLALDETGQTRRTYVILTNDNGYHQGEHRLVYGKGTPYEESIRVGAYVVGPGVAAGRIDRRLLGMHDVAPTILDLAGAPIPPFVDGTSFAPILRGQDQPARSAMLVANYNGRNWWAIRTPDAVYVEHEGGQREWYDLAADPYELENLIDEGRDPGDLPARLAVLRGCAREGCRSAESDPGDGPPAP